MTDDPDAVESTTRSRSFWLGFIFFAVMSTAVVLGIALAVGLPARMIAVVFFFMIGFFLIVLALQLVLSFLDGLLTKPARVDLSNRVDTPNVVVVETHPGKEFPHRLERAGSAPGCQFGCIVGVAIFWNGLVGIGVFNLIKKWNGGGFQWSKDLLIIPHVIIGLILIVCVLYTGLKWLTASLVGRVCVELSAHPLAPADKFRIHVAQTGLFSLSRVALWLVCTEEATYPGRKGSRIATQEVVKYAIANLDETPDGDGLPIAIDFQVPKDVMHSFAAPNNQINWTIRMEGVVLGLLPFATDYRVSVVPVQERILD